MFVKLQGWLFRILSTSSNLSKTNKTILLPWLRILNALFVCHNCLKVLTTASIWRKREVKNFAAMMNFPFLWSLGRTYPTRSFSNNVRFSHLIVSCSMFPSKCTGCIEGEKLLKNCIPKPHKNRTPLAQKVYLILLENKTNSPSKKGLNFYCLSKAREPYLLSSWETQMQI